MKNHRVQSRVVPFAVALLILLPVSAVRTGVATVSASSERNRELHVTKECSQNTRLPGGFCTITSTNLPAIKVGSKVYYTQNTGIPTAFALDSNVVLDAGSGNWAVGRCTLDLSFSGLCTFSDGTGQLTGLHARVAVSYTGGFDFRWDGTYSFRETDEDR
jgi:hypothetical protein